MSLQPSLLLLLALLAPWLILLLWVCNPCRALANRLAPAAAWPALGVVLFATPEQPMSLALGPLAFMGAQEAGLLTLAGTLLWSVLLPYGCAWGHRQAPQHAHILQGWLLATLGASLLVLFAAEMLAFYVGFALSSFFAWGLILFGKGAAARFAAWVYVSLMLVAELSLLVGLAALANQSDLSFGAVADGRLSGAPLLVFGLGCAIKMGVVGVHGWLPLAHGSAVLPASALLSGLLVKFGLLAWWHVAATSTSLTGLGWPLAVLGLFGAVYGAVLGLLQAAPKRVLAYSTVSQMGLLMLALGAALGSADPASQSLVEGFAVHHSMTKALAFLALGIVASSHRSLQRLGWLGLIWVLLALAGAPLTSGASAKAGLVELVQAAGFPDWLKATLSVTSLLTAAILTHLLLRLSDERPTATVGVGQWLPWLVLFGLCVSLPAVLPVGWYTGELWPLAMGIALAWLWRGRFVLPAPAGAPKLPNLGVRLECKLQRWQVVGRAMLVLALALLLSLWWGDMRVG